MKTNDDILAKMLESIKQALPSFHSRVRASRRYAKRFQLSFIDPEKEFIIKEILNSQNKSIAKAMLLRKNISIPNLGSFQYRESLEIIREIKNEVKAKYGVIDIRKVDEELYDIINKEIEEKKKEIILPLYFEQLGGKDRINYNFKNTDKK